MAAIVIFTNGKDRTSLGQEKGKAWQVGGIPCYQIQGQRNSFPGSQRIPHCQSPKASPASGLFNSLNPMAGLDNKLCVRRNV